MSIRPVTVHATTRVALFKGRFSAKASGIVGEEKYLYRRVRIVNEEVAEGKNALFQIA
jgi:hypothetical protein